MWRLTGIANSLRHIATVSAHPNQLQNERRGPLGMAGSSLFQKNLQALTEADSDTRQKSISSARIRKEKSAARKNAGCKQPDGTRFRSRVENCGDLREC